MHVLHTDQKQYQSHSGESHFLTFEVYGEFKQPTVLSDVVQPEVSLFLFNLPWHHQIFIAKCISF